MGEQDKENKEVAVLIEEAKGWFCENRDDSDFPCAGALCIQGVGEDSDGHEVALILCQAHREEWAVLNG